MNTNEKYNGIFTALLTPFNEAGEVNEGELIKLIKFNLDMGVRGFYVCGSTGESFLLSKEERMKIMEIVKREAEGSTLIAHIGSLDERDACEMARHAKALGYDAISSVAPFYFKFSPDEIRGYLYGGDVKKSVFTLTLRTSNNDTASRLGAINTLEAVADVCERSLPELDGGLALKAGTESHPKLKRRTDNGDDEYEAAFYILYWEENQ